MKFLVTGASGFVGGNLARVLVERGHEVTALVRRTSNKTELEKLGVKFAFGDVVTGEGLEAAVEGVDCVHHIAGIVKARTQDEYFKGNADGTRNVCLAIAKMKQPARLVLCSSLAAAGPTVMGKPKREEEEPQPISTYGRSKLAAELAARQFADRIPTVIARPCVVYGPGDITNVPPLFAMAKFGIFVKPGFSKKHLSFIHVNDLCDGLAALSTKGETIRAGEPTSGVYFFGDGTDYSWEDIFAAFCRAVGRPSHRVISVPETVGWVVGSVNELAGRLTNSIPIMNRDKAREMSAEAWTCSPRRAQTDLAYKPAFQLNDGFKHAVEWYRQKGML